MLKWVFGADVGPFKSGLDQMRGEVKAFSGSVKGMIAGAFGGAAVASWAKGMIEDFARIQDIADRFGVSAETVQRLGYSAKMSGTDAETAAKGYTKLMQSVAEAENGSEAALNAFATLGITVEEFKKLSPEQQLVALAKGLEDSGNGTQAFNAVLKLLGKSGAEIMPMLTQGVAALMDQLQRAPVAGGSAVKAIADLDDALTGLKAQGAPVFAFLVNSIRTFGLYAETVINSVVTGIQFALSAVKGEFASMDEAMKERNALKANLQKEFDNGWNDIWKKPEVKNAPKDGDSVVAKAQAAAEKEKEAERQRVDLAEKRKRIEEDIAKLQEDARQRSLNLEEKIADAEQRRFQAMLKAGSIEAFAKTSTDPDNKAQMEAMVLDAKKQQLEIEKELADLADQKKQAVVRAKEHQDQLQQSLTDTLAREKEMRHEMELDSMSPKDRVKALHADRRASDDTATKLDAKGTPESKKAAAEERMRGLSIQKSIESELKSIDAERQSKLKDLASEQEKLSNIKPVVATSSLASIGAGGSANLFTSESTERQQVDLLKQVVQLLSRGNDLAIPKSTAQERI